MAIEAKRATTSSSPTGPCEDPHGAERSHRAWTAVPGPAATYPAESCRWYTADCAPGVTPAETWPVSRPPATRRWLDTKDRRGRTQTDSIVYGPAELEFLSQNGIRCRGESRPKRREVHGHDNVFDDGAIDVGWASKVRHPRWKERSKVLDPRDHLFQRARARRLRGEGRMASTAPWGSRVDHLWRVPSDVLRNWEHRPNIIKPKSPTNACWPRFNVNMLPKDVRWKWYVDRALEASLVRGNQLSPIEGSYDSSWARAIGTHKADRLLARKLARRRAEERLESYVERRLPARRALENMVVLVARADAVRPWTPDFWASLPRQMAVYLARTDPKAYAWLAEADEDGATVVRPHVVAALNRALKRLTWCAGGRTLAADLAAVLRGKPGDGVRVLVAAAAAARGVRVTTFKKAQKNIAR